ncbi:hypothetical protein [Arthrobacter sp. CG_A4]|uniref:hypothetical protein n=1 Tax=Arthrobacter sp. CG_A4 TaxID=3071706 RepID=UPI002E01061E|nr:hypothetical protein [Arthrobacter sp. CG_A4]
MRPSGLRIRLVVPGNVRHNYGGNAYNAALTRELSVLGSAVETCRSTATGRWAARRTGGGWVPCGRGQAGGDHPAGLERHRTDGAGGPRRRPGRRPVGRAPGQRPGRRPAAKPHEKTAADDSPAAQAVGQ